MPPVSRGLRALRVRLLGPPSRSPRPRVAGTARRRVIAALSLSLAVWAGVAVWSESAQGRAADARLAELRARTEALGTLVDTRRREIAESQSDAWLADEARRLGYVRDGEQVYVAVAGASPLPMGGGVDTGPLPSFSAPAGAAPAPSTPAPALPGGTPAPPTPVVVVPGGGGR